MTVYILGAGASRAEGTPLTHNFLFESFQLAKSLPESPLGKRWKKLGQLLQALYGWSPFFSNLANTMPTDLQLKTINIEEVFTIIETALRRGEGFSKRLTPELLVSIREDLIFIVGMTLTEKLRYPVGIGYHIPFIQNHIQHSGESNPVIISFNYDILIDNALESERTGGNLDYDYGYEFARIVDNGIPVVRSSGLLVPGQSTKPFVTLLKPHGSLNWLTCPTCLGTTCFLHHKAFESIYRPFGGGYQSDDALLCARDQTRMRSNLVPPTYYKSFDSSIYQAIWVKVGKALRECTRIVVIGYSLPESDIIARYHFKRSLAQNRNQRVNIELVNKVTPRSDEDVFMKLKHFFGRNYIYTEFNEGFEQYAEHRNHV